MNICTLSSNTVTERDATLKRRVGRTYSMSLLLYRSLMSFLRGPQLCLIHALVERRHCARRTQAVHRTPRPACLRLCMTADATALARIDPFQFSFFVLLRVTSSTKVAC